MSLTPKKSLMNFLESIFRGSGTPLSIGGVEYILREKGELSEQNPLRRVMLDGLQNQARRDPGMRYICKVGPANEKVMEKKPTLQIKYVQETEIVDPEVQKNRQYIIVENVPYRVEITGDFRSVMTIERIRESGREMIESYKKKEGRLPQFIEVEHTLSKDRNN